MRNHYGDSKLDRLPGGSPAVDFSEMSRQILKEIISAMNLDLKMKTAAVLAVVVLFIVALSTVGRGQRAIEQDTRHDIGTLDYRVGVDEKLLDRYGDKIEAIDQRTIRLESAVESIKGQIGWLDGLFGTCLVMMLGALGGTVYQRVIASRGKESP